MTSSGGQPNPHDGDRFRPGDVLSGRYELLEEVGSGASAITWRARDQRLDRVVAVKVLRADYAADPTFAQRFDREARTAASVSHGNVVDVYDVGHDGDALYLVMQFVAGEDLKQHIQRHGRLDAERARGITTQVLTGLGAIHSVGIIHRDIKPQNVLIGRDGVARVADFGVAQVSIDVGLTTAGTTVGTAAYMAPEQARAEILSEATDLYAVGVMLYEMLTGRLPFQGSTPMAMMLAHIEQPPPLPSATSSVTDQFDGIVRQAMAKRPEDRFRSASAMARAIQYVANSGGSGARTIVVSEPPVGVATTAAVTARAPRAPIRPETVSAPARPREATGLDWARQSARTPERAASGGMRGVLWGVLLLVILLLGVIGVSAYNEYFADSNESPPARTPPVLATRTPAQPTNEPEATDEPPVIVPGDGEDGAPTDEPQPTEQPEATDEPTDEPTNEPEPTEKPTDEQVIEPVDTETSAEDYVIVPDSPTETPAG